MTNGSLMKVESIRIFDLLDRVPKVPNEGGDVYDPMDGRKFNTIDFHH